MSKATKNKIVCEKYITDFRGHEICPGNVVAVSRSGRSSRELEMNIVTAITKSRIFYPVITYEWLRDKDKNWIKDENGNTVKKAVLNYMGIDQTCQVLSFSII